MKFNETTLTCLKSTSLIIQKYQKTEIYYDHNEQSLPDCMISYLQGQL